MYANGGRPTSASTSTAHRPRPSRAPAGQAEAETGSRVHLTVFPHSFAQSQNIKLRCHGFSRNDKAITRGSNKHLGELQLRRAARIQPSRRCSSPKKLIRSLQSSRPFSV